MYVANYKCTEMIPATNENILKKNYSICDIGVQM